MTYEQAIEIKDAYATYFDGEAGGEGDVWLQADDVIRIADYDRCRIRYAG